MCVMLTLGLHLAFLTSVKNESICQNVSGYTKSVYLHVDTQHQSFLSVQSFHFLFHHPLTPEEAK